MKRAWVAAAAIFLSGSVWAGPVRRADKCNGKPTDRCGCHTVYGLRHCHPNMKTRQCEAPVRGEKAPEKAQKPVVVEL